MITPRTTSTDSRRKRLRVVFDNSRAATTGRPPVDLTTRAACSRVPLALDRIHWVVLMAHVIIELLRTAHSGSSNRDRSGASFLVSLAFIRPMGLGCPLIGQPLGIVTETKAFKILPSVPHRTRWYVREAAQS